MTAKLVLLILYASGVWANQNAFYSLEAQRSTFLGFIQVLTFSLVEADQFGERVVREPVQSVWTWTLFPSNFNQLRLPNSKMRLIVHPSENHVMSPGQVLQPTTSTDSRINFKWILHSELCRYARDYTSLVLEKGWKGQSYGVTINFTCKNVPTATLSGFAQKAGLKLPDDLVTALTAHERPYNHLGFNSERVSKRESETSVSKQQRKQSPSDSIAAKNSEILENDDDGEEEAEEYDKYLDEIESKNDGASDKTDVQASKENPVIDEAVQANSRVPEKKDNKAPKENQMIDKAVQANSEVPDNKDIQFPKENPVVKELKPENSEAAHIENSRASQIQKVLGESKPKNPSAIGISDLGGAKKNRV